MALGSFGAFISQMSLLLYFSKENKKKYSEKILFLVVFLYSLMLCTVFMALSYYYNGDTFMFSKTDAMIYYKDSIKAYDIGFQPNMAFIIKKYAFDDWGAFLFDSLLMSIIPDKLFLNFVYTIIGALSSVLIFRIARHFMNDTYAFVGALAYGTSSFMIFFHCTFLKESLFVTIIICVMYYICRFIHKENDYALFAAFFFLSLLFFFRPAVAAFIIISFFVYLAINNHGSATSLFMYLGIFIMFFIAMQSMMDIANGYSAGGEEKLRLSGNDKAYSGGFNTFVNIFGGFFGPFPTFFTKKEGMPSSIQFYSSGLSYRLFLIIPFLLGLYFIVRDKVIELFPIVAFILVEMLATGVVAASLELRKVLPHIPLTYIVSFYGLSRWRETNRTKRILEIFVYIIGIIILLLWNVVKKT